MAQKALSMGYSIAEQEWSESFDPEYSFFLNELRNHLKKHKMFLLGDRLGFVIYKYNDPNNINYFDISSKIICCNISDLFKLNDSNLNDFILYNLHVFNKYGKD